MRESHPLLFASNLIFLFDSSTTHNQKQSPLNTRDRIDNNHSAKKMKLKASGLTVVACIAIGAGIGAAIGVATGGSGIASSLGALVGLVFGVIFEVMFEHQGQNRSATESTSSDQGSVDTSSASEVESDVPAAYVF